MEREPIDINLYRKEKLRPRGIVQTELTDVVPAGIRDTNADNLAKERRKRFHIIDTVIHTPVWDDTENN